MDLESNSNTNSSLRSSSNPIPKLEATQWCKEPSQKKLPFVKNIRVNPLAIASSALLLLSPFLTWVTLVALVIVNGVLITGFAVQSNLWDLANSKAGLPLHQFMATSSIISFIFLIIGGLTSLRKMFIGLVVASLGFTIFVASSYNIFGYTQNGVTSAYISPGIGFFVALIGLITGGVSMNQKIAKKNTIRILVQSLKTGQGLLKAGLFVSIVSIVLDGLNHAALGQLADFLGSRSSLEMLLHNGFYISLAVLAIGFAVIAFQKKNKEENENYGLFFLISSILIVAAVNFLISDALLHSLNGGGFEKFIGHNSVEITLHIMGYYGVVLLILGRFIMS